MMRRAFVLIAIAALLVCVIPLVDSSDAAGETYISGYLYEGSKDISTASNIYICIIYSNDGGNTGKIVGSTTSLGTLGADKTNKFSISITPEADLVMSHYYIYFNIYGYSVNYAPGPMEKQPTIMVGEVAYNNCYQLKGDNIVVGSDNVLANGDRFLVSSARGTVSGKVTVNAQEPTYITGVRVTLFDLDTKEDIKEATDVTNNDGYSINYNTGTYGIRFELGGYDTVTSEVTILENADVQLTVAMKENQSYFGLDLPHAMMILGGATGVILILFAVIRRARM